ncbi:MAG: nucleotide exchange factor GrpE [Mogibacterium sp.]|nr:nucleotide exchange factor GrpE [Mogibacterium sp.]
MTKITGIYLSHGTIQVCLIHNREYIQFGVPMQTEATEEQFYGQLELFDHEMSKVCRLLEINYRITEPAFVFTVPDYFGVSDYLRIRSLGRACGIPVFRFVSRSLAAVGGFSRRNPQEFRCVAVSPGAGCTAFTLYESGDGILEKLETVIVSDPKKKGKQIYCDYWNQKPAWNRERVGGLFLLEGNWRNSKYQAVMHAADLPHGCDFASAELLPDREIRGGLFNLCEKLEGWTKESWLYLTTLSPYALWLGSGKEVIRMFWQNLTIPAMKESEIRLQAGSEGDGPAEIVLYEEREDRLCAVGSAKVRMQESGIYRMELEADANAGIVVSLVDPVSGKKTAVLDESGFRADPEEPDGEQEWDDLEQTVRMTETAVRDLAEQAGEAGFRLEKWLPVFDNIEYGFRYSMQSDDPNAEGFRKIYRQIGEILRQEGIERIDQVNVPFDVSIHNAVAHVTDIDLPENAVKEVVLAGYRKDGRVIRTASVVAAN